MIIKSADFTVSNTKISKLPPPELPEYAFIGRSNVGKSSLINMLVDVKGLAKTSQKPGKTQLINHFLINKAWYIVDLPGYGYAKSSKSNREDWAKFIRFYLEKRESLQCVFVLIDSRLEPQKIDIEFCCSLGERGIPFILAFTKADKQGNGKSQQNMALFRKELLEFFEEIPQMILTSAETQLGKEDILQLIHQTNQDFIIPEYDTAFYT
ncbi:ribosome biogenesis GTP-binding protein YihA/YsxC [Pedobacter cryophilus]|jgi:GTP-binding protein|uniref:Probable GTP-binding protein EngB n=1 Tax=Pedobacter cryophilus TaxID=2571271 RepID=A0A4U1BX85_9SPHI|nr:ribosome biogenesis GTP-binding protein YihA/YsxC [Pedobacter cryophilus]TKB96974.1 YihA family ribosome biogenesis GTP-binding protein [Pedobacter cryophilus]